MTARSIRLDLQPPVARLTLTGDGTSLAAGTLADLRSACETIDATEGIALVMLTAEGDSFCEEWDDSVRASGGAIGVDPFGCLAGLPCPSVAALQGAVRGPGLELALAADIRVCRDDAVFSLPDVAGESLPLAGASARLPRIAGRSVAASMLLLGEELDAQGAYRCGLVSRVFARDAFDASTEELAQRVAANGPIALRYAKELVHNGIELPLDQALRYELDLSIILQTTHDRAEGVEAFLAKRPPRFEGR